MVPHDSHALDASDATNVPEGSVGTSGLHVSPSGHSLSSVHDCAVVSLHAPFSSPYASIARPTSFTSPKRVMSRMSLSLTEPHSWPLSTSQSRSDEHATVLPSLSVTSAPDA